MEFFEKHVNPYSLAVVRHMERYSASVLERETTFCFFADQEMRLEPRKMPYPVVERLSSGLLAQSASVGIESERTFAVMMTTVDGTFKISEDSLCCCEVN